MRELTTQILCATVDQSMVDLHLSKLATAWVMRWASVESIDWSSFHVRSFYGDLSFLVEQYGAMQIRHYENAVLVDMLWGYSSE